MGKCGFVDGQSCNAKSWDGDYKPTAYEERCTCRKRLKPGETMDETKPMQAVIMAHVCGGKQAHICPVTKQPHDMSALVRFPDGESIACKDCGVTAMQIDMMELP